LEPRATSTGANASIALSFLVHTICSGVAQLEPLGKNMTSQAIANLVEEERGHSTYIPLAQAISPFRITPFARRLRWPYSSEQMEFPCWIIADLGSQKPGLTLAYCEFGQGARGDRWGIVGPPAVAQFGR
jgi:hypothetical protein